MSQPTPQLLSLLILFLLALSACGAEDQTAPAATLPPRGDCPTLDEVLESTSQSAQRGELDPLRASLDNLKALEEPADPLAPLLKTLLVLLGDLPPQSNTSSLSPELTQTLESLAAPLLAHHEDGTPNLDNLLVLDLLGESLTTCEEGAWTHAIRALLLAPELVPLLFDAIADPATREKLLPLLEPNSRRTTSILFSVLLGQLTAENFSFDAFIAPLAAILPTEDPPLKDLVDVLRDLLQGERLKAIQTPLQCTFPLTRENSQGMTQNGGQLVGALLFDLLSGARNLDPSKIGDALNAETLDNLKNTLENWLEALEADPVYKEDLTLVLQHLLQPSEIRNALEGLLALLRAGALEDLAGAANALLNTSCEPAP